MSPKESKNKVQRKPEKPCESLEIPDESAVLIKYRKDSFDPNESAKKSVYKETSETQ